MANKLETHDFEKNPIFTRKFGNNPIVVCAPHHQGEWSRTPIARALARGLEGKFIVFKASRTWILIGQMSEAC